MQYAPKTWALVVGIDKYNFASVPTLTGAVADAAAALQWLLDLGVPVSNIRVNVSPVSDNRITSLGITPRDATALSIWASINEISNAAGERLYVFYSGHGLYDISSGRLLLPQEYGEADNWDALDLDKYIQYFCSLNFERQFLFFDGCQNYPCDPKLRSKVNPTGPKRKDFVPKPTNGLIACFAAAQGQRAVEVVKRGAMMRRLLSQLDIGGLKKLSTRDPLYDSIVYGWHDGSRCLDIKRLFDNALREQVRIDAQGEGVMQTPQVVPFGKAASLPFLPFLELPLQATGEVAIDVMPAAARKAVEQIFLNVKFPAMNYRQPIVPPIQLPDSCRVLQSATVESYCDPCAGWRVKERPPTIAVVQSRHDLLFEIEPEPPAVPPPDLNAFNVRMSPAAAPPPYESLARQTGLSMPEEGPVRMLKHEYGPDFEFSSEAYGPDSEVSAEAYKLGAVLCGQWARAIRRWVKTSDIVVAPPGKTSEQCLPNLRFDIMDGWSRRLAGFLAEAPLITIERGDDPNHGSLWSADGAYSAALVEDLRAIRTVPGRNRIRIDMPWGSWTGFADVPLEGEVALSLPHSLSGSPLRNDAPEAVPLAHIMTRRESGNLWVWDRRLDPDGRTTEWFFYHIPRDAFNLAEHLLITVEGGRGEWSSHDSIRFTIPSSPNLPLTVLVDPRGPGPRVEPYSNTTLVEWDLLISAGRLDALAPARIHALCGDFWPYTTGWPVKLAVAYAACAARLWDDLDAALENLVREGIDCFDVDLLACMLQRAHGAPYEAAFSRALSRLESRAVPVLRWGVTLAHRLFEDPGEVLRMIELTVSPASAFTVWTMQPNTEQDPARHYRVQPAEPALVMA